MALSVQKTLIIIAFYAAASLPLLARAQEEQAGCEAFRDVVVTIDPVFDPPQYDHSLTLREIQRLARDSNHSIHEGIVLGLTYYQPIVQFSTPVQVMSYPDGLSCAQVQKADVTFGYHDVTIYIANEIEEGSCGFDEVMAHERRHVAVNEQILAKYTPIIQTRLAEYLKFNGMFREGNADYAVSLIKQKMQEILNDLGGQMFNENQKLQEQIDTPEEYRRLSYVCDGQLGRIALRSRTGRN